MMIEDDELWKAMKPLVRKGVQKVLDIPSIVLGCDKMSINEFFAKVNAGGIHISTQGFWFRNNFGDDVIDVRYKCSNCGKYTIYAEKFCPNCGSFNNCKVIHDEG